MPFPLPAMLAILSALFFAVSNVSVKLGLPGSNPVSAFFADIITSAIIFTIPLAFIIPTGPISILGIAFFATSGVVGTTLGRITQAYAIERMGASTSTSIANTFPIISTLAAVLLLGESVTILIIVGTALTIIGLFVISLRHESTKWTSKYLIVPLSSAIFFGSGVTLRKVGLNLIPFPLFGLAITVYAALLSLLIFMAISRKYRSEIKLARKNVAYFGLAGLMDSLALIALFEALEYGFVTIVGPLSSVVPLFVLVFARIFLRQVEVVHRRLVIGAVIVVAGLVLVAG